MENAPADSGGAPACRTSSPRQVPVGDYARTPLLSVALKSVPVDRRAANLTRPRTTARCSGDAADRVGVERPARGDRRCLDGHDGPRVVIGREVLDDRDLLPIGRAPGGHPVPTAQDRVAHPGARHREGLVGRVRGRVRHDLPPDDARARGTCCTGRALDALRALGTDRTGRTDRPRCADRTGDTLSAHRTGVALRTHRSGVALDALDTLDALRPLRASVALRTGVALRSLGTDRTLRALDALWTDRASVALDTGVALDALGTLEALSTRGAGGA